MDEDWSLRPAACAAFAAKDKLRRAGKRREYDGTVNTHAEKMTTNRTLGRRYYEVTDHLGNVLATVLDRKTGVKIGEAPTMYDHWSADLAQVSDYYPGGMMMPGRNLEWDWSRHGFNGQMKTDEVYGRGNLNTALFWEMDTRIVRRWNIDPVDQVSISNYAVFGNNSIMYSDPDGKEKIIALSKTSELNEKIIKGAQKYQDDNAIHIFAHGSSKGMTVEINGKIMKIRNAEQLDEFLSENSSVWKNKKHGEHPVIVLHSCRTGRMDKDGSSSFAQKVSKSETFKDSKIIAPDERVYIPETGQLGTFKAKFADENGDYKTNSAGEIKSKQMSNIPGSWHVFKNGQDVGSFRGDWNPKEIPTPADELTKRQSGSSQESSSKKE